MEPVGRVVRKYHAASISPDAREALGRVGAVLNDDGMAGDALLSVLSRAGYSVGRATLFRWMRTLRDTGHVLSQHKRSGKYGALTDEEAEILVGCVIDGNRNNKEVHIWDVIDIAKRMGKDLGESTTYRYLHERGIGSKVARSQGSGLGVNTEVMGEMALDWFDTYQGDGGLGCPRNELYCADYVVSTVRTSTISTLSPIGGAQPRVAPPEAIYSDSIVYVVRADGDQTFRPMAFTRNPVVNGERDRATQKKFRTWNIPADDVVFVPGKGNYCAEHQDSTSHYFDQYDHYAGGTILTDNGSSWKFGGESMPLDKGFNNHIYFPPAIHQNLSVMDNGVNGVAKKIWRSKHSALDSDLDRTLCLMQSLQEVNPEHIRSFFVRNLCLDMDELSRPVIEALVRGSDNPQSEKILYFDKCHQQYLQFNALKNKRDSRTLTKSGLGLDGSYWQ
jgi:transposase